MIRLLHLVDDPNLGGVNRMLAGQQDQLGRDIAASTLVVNPRRLALPAELAEADVVVVHFTLAWRKLPFMARLRLALGRRPLVLVEHSYTQGYEQHCVAHQGRFRAMLKLGMALADVVVAVSQGQAGWLAKAGLVPARKLRVIEPVADLNGFAEVPALARHEGPLRLGCIGRYAPQKGLFDLLEAMRAVAPELASLTLAGYGEDEAALRAAAAGMSHVEIGGPVARPAEFLANVDAVVVPSLWEAYGLVATEARAAGRPVLVADLDGLSEQVPAALRMAPGAPAAIAERITWLAGQDLAALGEALRGTTHGAVQRHCNAWGRLVRRVALPTPAMAQGQLSGATQGA